MQHDISGNDADITVKKRMKRTRYERHMKMQPNKDKGHHRLNNSISASAILHFIYDHICLLFGIIIYSIDPI
jgi:hypothetical protein